MFFCFFLFGQRFLDNPRAVNADSRQSLHAGVLWLRVCLLPFWGLAAPGGRKKGEMKFSLLWESMGNFCILAVLSDISATRGRIHTKFYLYRNNVCWRAPPPLGSISPWVAGGVKNSKKWGWSHSCIGQLATISIFFSVAKCDSICRAQTCAHCGVEPSRSAKAFLQGAWAKKFEKI